MKTFSINSENVLRVAQESTTTPLMETTTVRETTTSTQPPTTSTTTTEAPRTESTTQPSTSSTTVRTTPITTEAPTTSTTSSNPRSSRKGIVVTASVRSKAVSPRLQKLGLHTQSTPKPFVVQEKQAFFKRNLLFNI